MKIKDILWMLYMFMGGQIMFLIIYYYDPLIIKVLAIGVSLSLISFPTPYVILNKIYKRKNE